jgi:hypothetical protein
MWALETDEATRADRAPSWKSAATRKLGSEQEKGDPGPSLPAL